MCPCLLYTSFSRLIGHKTYDNQALSLTASWSKLREIWGNWCDSSVIVKWQLSWICCFCPPVHQLKQSAYHRTHCSVNFKHKTPLLYSSLTHYNVPTRRTQLPMNVHWSAVFACKNLITERTSQLIGFSFAAHIFKISSEAYKDNTLLYWPQLDVYWVTPPGWWC